MPRFESRSSRNQQRSKDTDRRGPVNRRPRTVPRNSEALLDPSLLFGRHPVLEALRAGRDIGRIYLQEKIHEGSIREIMGLCREKNIPMVTVPRVRLDSMTMHQNHQGVAASVSVKSMISMDDVEELIAGTTTAPLLYVLDTIQDPQNFGAILRVANATGASAVIVPEHGSVGLTPVVAKASAGAVEYVAVAQVKNLVQAMERLKAWGFFIFGSDPDASMLYTDADWTGAVALVIGAEGRGMRSLVKERCDGLVKLPMLGQVASLNAASAAAVLGFEVVRQRRARDGSPLRR